MNWLYIAIGVVILCGLSYLSSKLDVKPKKRSNKPEDYKGKYEAQNLLTVNEKMKFTTVKSAAIKLNLLLFAKVRLADIITPKEDCKPWQVLFNKVQSKHVDFLLCDSTMKPICVIEIDDSSHDQENRKERDKFVDTVLKDVGIHILHKRGSFTALELESEIRKEITPNGARVVV